MPPIRVLLWCYGGAGSHYNGAGMNAARMYARCAPEHAQVTLVHGSPSLTLQPPFVASHFLSDVSRPSVAAQVRFLAHARSWLAQHYCDFDVFHGMPAMHMAVLPAAWSEALGLPAVVKVANHRTDLADKAGVKALLGLPRWRRRAVKSLSAVIAISEEIEQELLEYGVPREKIVRIPNGVDTQLFCPAGDCERSRARVTLGLDDVPTIIFSGAVIPRKRPDLVVTAFRDLVGAGHSCQLLIAGPTPDLSYKESLLKLVRGHRSESGVHWLGFQRDMDAIYRAGDIFALPSNNEGMPNAVLEAMSSGLACIATPVSGVPELLKGGAGIVLDRDAVRLTEAIDGLLRDSMLRSQFGRIARLRAENGYSSDAILHQHLQLFSRLIETRGSQTK